MDLTNRLQNLYAGAVYDVLNEMGRDNCVLPHDIVALSPGDRLAGQIYTIDGEYSVDMDKHETLLAWATVLSKVPNDKVVVCQPNTHEIALMGELSAETLRQKGVRGYVADGACRDADFILEMEFPVFCKFNTPKDIVGRWKAKSMGEPIDIGGVTVNTGDWLLADRDGVVIVPEELADEVIEKTEAVAEQENSMRNAILSGMDPVVAYNKFGTF